MSLQVETVSELACDPPVGHRAQRFAPDRVTSLVCTDPAELGAVVREWRGEFLRLERGPFRSDGVLIPLGTMLLGKLALDRTVLHRVQSPTGATSFVMPGAGTTAVFVNGQKVGSGGCIVMSAATSLEVITRGHAVGYSLSVSDDMLHRSFGWLEESSAASRGARIVVPQKQRAAALVKTIDRAIDAITSHPEALGKPEIMGSIADRLLATLHSASHGATAKIIARRDRSRRRIAVERARDYIRQNLSEPIRLSDLCRHAHLQARSLEYGFRETVGVSPVGYVKMLRLGDVRRCLLSPTSLHRSISEVALDAGFWHLSQFSVDYKRLFMESPSATRLRAAAAARAARSSLSMVPLARQPQRESTRFEPRGAALAIS